MMTHFEILAMLTLVIVVVMVTMTMMLTVVMWWWWWCPLLVSLFIHTSRSIQVQGYKVSELLDTSQLKQWSRV